MADDITRDQNLEKIDRLLNEFEEQRIELKKMIEEVQTIKQKLDKLIPEPNNNDSDFRNHMKGSRYVSLFEERVKSITEFFRIILDMRREISKTIKDEVELRRKAEMGLGSGDLSELLDISKLADDVEKLSKKAKNVKQKHNKGE